MMAERKDRRRFCFLGLMAGVALLSLPRLCFAGNADAFYLSGEAALSGGAVVATTSGGSSIWYNPAGLAALEGLRLDVNVSGYALRFGATADFDSTVPNTKETRLTLLDIDVVPAALTLTRKFGDLGVGIGVFVPSQSAVVLRTQLESPPDGRGNALDFGYDSTNRVQEYHAGPGVGWSPSPVLNLGASLLANYRTRVEVTDVSATVESSVDAPQTTKTSLFRHNTLDSQGVGLEMILGGQWRFSEAFTLGAVVRTPAVRLGEAVHSVDSELVADSNGSIDDSVVFDRRFGVSTQVLTPFRFHGGAAFEHRDVVVSAEGSVLLPFDNVLFDLEERTTWNARAGVRRQLNPVWSMGGGVFTDRSPFNEPTQFQQSQLNYYGATIAVDWINTYRVISKGERAFDEPRALNFGTTIALSYALGVGKIAGVRVGPADDGGIQFVQNVVDVVAHEVTLHIGSTLSE